jgi:hypothetical protein
MTDNPQWQWCSRIAAFRVLLQRPYVELNPRTVRLANHWWSRKKHRYVNSDFRLNEWRRDFRQHWQTWGKPVQRLAGLRTAEWGRGLTLWQFWPSLWSTAILGEDNSSASQEISRILWNPEVYYRTHNGLPPDPKVSNVNPAHNLTLWFLNINFIITFPYRVPHHNSCPISHSSHLPWSVHPNSIWGVKIMKLIMLISATSVTPSLLIRL